MTPVQTRTRVAKGGNDKESRRAKQGAFAARVFGSVNVLGSAAGQQLFEHQGVHVAPAGPEHH